MDHKYSFANIFKYASLFVLDYVFVLVEVLNILFCLKYYLNLV